VALQQFPEGVDDLRVTEGLAHQGGLGERDRQSGPAVTRDKHIGDVVRGQRGRDRIDRLAVQVGIEKRRIDGLGLDEPQRVLCAAGRTNDDTIRVRYKPRGPVPPAVRPR
jgi:hypothetical protein